MPTPWDRASASGSFLPPQVETELWEEKNNRGERHCPSKERGQGVGEVTPSVGSVPSQALAKARLRGLGPRPPACAEGASSAWKTHMSTQPGGGNYRVALGDQRAQHPERGSHHAGGHLRPCETHTRHCQGFQFCEKSPESFNVVDYLLLKTHCWPVQPCLRAGSQVASGGMERKSLRIKWGQMDA